MSKLRPIDFGVHVINLHEVEFHGRARLIAEVDFQKNTITYIVTLRKNGPDGSEVRKTVTVNSLEGATNVFNDYAKEVQ